MSFDSSIMTYTEKLGFNVRSSRKYKFYVLFICLGLYVTGFIFKESFKVQDNYYKPIWLINVSTSQDDCSDLLYNGENPGRIGIDSSYDQSAILFYIIFMSFGASFSLVEVDSIEWVYSSCKSKVLRLLLATLFIGILDFVISYWIKSQYIIYIAHYCFIPFVMYGPFIVWC